MRQSKEQRQRWKRARKAVRKINKESGFIKWLFMVYLYLEKKLGTREAAEKEFAKIIPAAKDYRLSISVRKKNVRSILALKVKLPLFFSPFYHAAARALDSRKMQNMMKK